LHIRKNRNPTAECYVKKDHKQKIRQPKKSQSIQNEQLLIKQKYLKMTCFFKSIKGEVVERPPCLDASSGQIFTRI
jgi:hypothetical protein